MYRPSSSSRVRVPGWLIAVLAATGLLVVCGCVGAVRGVLGSDGTTPAGQVQQLVPTAATSASPAASPSPSPLPSASPSPEAVSVPNPSDPAVRNPDPDPTTRKPDPVAPSPDPVAPDPGDDDGVYYANCTEARAAGAAPLHRGEPGYRAKLDRDGDGVACE